MGTIDDIRRLVALEHGLASISTRRDDGSVHVAVVNAGLVEHPDDGAPVAAFVSRPATRKLANLRHHPQATLLWRAGWAWVAAEGTAEIVEGDAALLRRIYTAAGGSEHEDWADYDRVMATEARVAVLLRPTRIYLNP